jgi:hypothetical protein
MYSESQRTEWPLLDAATEAAIARRSDDDLYQEGPMFTLGEFLSSSLSTEEIKKWIPIVLEAKGYSACVCMSEPRAELVAHLTFQVIDLAMYQTGYHNLNDSASMLMRLTADEVKDAAEEAGLVGTGSKVDLVVSLVELVFSDVLVPVSNSS